MNQPLPICENVREQNGLCPRSDVVHYADHGPPQAIMYSSFGCKTCKKMFIVWAEGMLEKAKKNQLDKTIGNLVNDRFKGYV
jgi:hypothetical protein